MEVHKAYLNSEAFGCNMLYENHNWDELIESIYKKGFDYKKGCKRGDWAYIVDLYPILVEKYGYFKLIVVSKEHTLMYDMRYCENGMVKWFQKDKWLPDLMECKKNFEQEYMVVYFYQSHYQEICVK